MAAVMAYLTAAHSNFGRYAVITAVVNSKFPKFWPLAGGGSGTNGTRMPPPELERTLLVSSTTSAAIQKAGRQKTSIESPLMPT